MIFLPMSQLHCHQVVPHNVPDHRTRISGWVEFFLLNKVGWLLKQQIQNMTWSVRKMVHTDEKRVDLTVLNSLAAV